MQRVPIICLVLGVLAGGGGARAQDLVAPRVKSLPGMEVPADVEVPESGVVRVLVRIDPDGTGVVEKCDAGRALCDLVDEAIAQAVFVPATRDGEPVSSQVSVNLRVQRPGPDGVSEPAPPETTLGPEITREEATHEAFAWYGET